MADTAPRASAAGTAHDGGAYAAYALGLLTLINVLNYVDRNVVYALFEDIKGELVLSDQQLGWLGSAYVIVLSLAALPLGVIGDLKSRRAVITFSVTLWSAFTAVGGLARHFWQLFACRAMVGVGEAGYGPAAQGLIAAHFPGRRRASAIGIYSVGMALGGVLGIWIGGVLKARFGWRDTFLFMGVPGFLLALLAARLREPAQQAPTGLLATARHWIGHGVRQLVHLASPLIALTLVGAAVSGALAAIGGLKSELDAAVFAVFVSLGIAWTIWRLVPLALQRTAEAGQVAASAFEEFLHAAGTVFRTPTLVWIFVGGALVTFAMNGLIAWAPSFMKRVHGLEVEVVGREFGVFALAGGALGALAGGRLGDLLLPRWSGGRVFVTGIGFVLGAPVCAALLLVERSGPFVPLLVATFFLYTWYNGPLSAVIFDVVPAAVRSSVIGAYVLFSHLAGDAIAPPLIGALSDRVGLRQAMLLLPAAGLAGGLVVMIALRTVGRDMRRVQA